MDGCTDHELALEPPVDVVRTIPAGVTVFFNNELDVPWRKFVTPEPIHITKAQILEDRLFHVDGTTISLDPPYEPLYLSDIIANPPIPQAIRKRRS